MRAYLIRVLVASLIFSGLLPAALGQERNTAAAASRAEIVGVVNAFMSAWNNSDIDSLAGLFTEDGNFLSPSGADARSRREIRHLLAQERQAGQCRAVPTRWTA